MRTRIITSYEKLLEMVKDPIILESVFNLVHWDMETMMPPRGIELRSQQLALIKQIEHKIRTNPKIGKLLDKLLKHPDHDDLNQIQKRNVFLIKKEYDEQVKLPEKLVKETARQEAITVDVWKKAKAAKDYSIYKPELRKLFELKKKAAEILMDVKKTATPYDALIDIFEPKMPAKKITKIFNGLKDGLITLIEKCENSSKQPDVSVLKRKVPIQFQSQISNAITKFVDYDTESKKAGGRIDETEHPFTTGYFDDVRITTHYHKDNFTSALFSTLHEAGHAIYEQNINHKFMYQPVGEGCSYGFHESQSRFVENILGRSRDFWVYFFPVLKQLTGNVFSDVELDTFIKAINNVKPSKIRIEADEVTYSLHVIIRFNIEQDLFAGKISISELPEVWNQSYKEYFGVDIEHDSEGVMQDTHWASGYFGYFPSYTLGNIYSGQILNEMKKELPEWRRQISKGNFKEIKQWMIKNVQVHGKLYDPSELIKKITGKEINFEPFLNYLNQKYSELYGF